MNTLLNILLCPVVIIAKSIRKRKIFFLIAYFGVLITAPVQATSDIYAKLKESAEKKLVVVTIKHHDPTDIQRNLSTLFPNAVFSIDTQTRQLLFKAVPSDIKNIFKAIYALDTPIPQIKVEVQIVEVNTNKLKQYQQLLTALAQGFSVNYDFDTKKLTASGLEGTLSAWIGDGSAKILSKPNVVALNNHNATIQIGDRIPFITTISSSKVTLDQTQYSTQIMDTGIILNIRPQIVSANTIQLALESEISTIKLWKDIGSAQFPILSSRKTKTDVVLNNKETLVIAGLLDESKKTTRIGIPFLSNIPLIGGLFQNEITETIQNDILFLIRPEIL